MYYKDIREALGTLKATNYQLEDMYIENGGEVTEETELLEMRKKALEDLLSNEGVDDLGRYLKSLEDRKAAYKAEKAKLAAMEKANESSIEALKVLVGDILRETGRDKVKGSFYSFTPYISVTKEVDKELLKAEFYQVCVDAIRKAGVPEYVTLTLGASSTAVPAGEQLPDVFIVNEKPTSKFVKPRTPKENN